MRKTYVAFVLVAPIAAGAAAAPAKAEAALPAEGWQLAQEDSFNRPTLGMDWLVVRGDWRLEDGVLRITRPWSSDSAVRTAGRLGPDVRVALRARTTGPASVLAVLVRRGDQSWDGGGRPPLLPGQKRGALAPTLTGPAVVLGPAGGGEGYGTAYVVAEHEQWHDIVIEYRGGCLKAWVDGKQARDERVDLSGRFNDYVVFWALRDAEFDDVRVWTRKGQGFSDIPQASPEDNRRATVDAAKIIDRSKADLGLQAAIDSLPAAGGAIVLPPGEFVLRRPVFLPSGVTVRGQGRQTVVTLPKPIPMSRITGPVAAEATSLNVENASVFRPGDLLNFRGGPLYELGSSALDPLTIMRIEGNTLHLNRPLGVSRPADRGNFVANFFPLFHSAHQSDVEVCDLTVRGWHDDPAPADGAYGACPVTFFFTREVRVRNVHVHGWKGDGISLQGGRDNFITDCHVEHAVKGFHPGSCQRRTIMSRLTAEHNRETGFFFCRYNQFSVVARNAFHHNPIMINGLAGMGDAMNAVNFNFGRGNAAAMPVTSGANDVFAGNVFVNSGKSAAIELFGGRYDGPPHRHFFYGGPARYFVVVDNRVVDQRPAAEALSLAVVDHPGAASNVVAANRLATSGAAPEVTVKIQGHQSVAVDNAPLQGPWQAPEPLPVPPAQPQPVVSAAADYAPQREDLGFQRAMDRLAAAGGGTLLLPAGVYELRSRLGIPGGVTVAGEGVATILVWRGRGPALGARGAQRVGVRDLSLRGERDGETAVELRDVQHAVLDALTIERFGSAGIILYNSRDVHLSTCKVRGCNQGYRIGGSSGVTLLESSALESRAAGIHITAATGPIRIENCIIWRSGAHGVEVEAHQTPTAIRSCVITTSGLSGVACSKARNVAIYGNVIHNSSLQERGRAPGVRIADSAGVLVRANRIVDDQYRPTQLVAVAETGNSDGSQVIYNVCCPNYVCPEASGEALIRLAGPTSSARHNVLHAYSGP